MWLTRPVTLDLLTRLSALLQAQSPWRGRVAGSGLADAEDVERQAARAMAERDGRIRRGVAVSRPGASGADGTAWLVSRVLVEGVDGDAACVRVGLAGAALGSASAAAPLAALELDRAQAQEFLSVVQEKALRAGWVRGAAATGQRQQTTH